MCEALGPAPTGQAIAAEEVEKLNISDFRCFDVLYIYLVHALETDFKTTGLNRSSYLRRGEEIYSTISAILFPICAFAGTKEGYTEVLN